MTGSSAPAETQPAETQPAAPDGAAPTTSLGRLWLWLPESLREALLPFLVARVVVLGALGLAHFVVDRTKPANSATLLRVHQGLLGWDAGWYESIARVGYKPLGTQSLRFFPLVPLLTHGLALVPGLGDGPALVLLANAAALAATALLFLLARRELGAPRARRTIWILSLLPASFVLVMGYAESVLLLLAVGCFLALRPRPDVDGARPRFALAAGLVFLATLTRPVGFLLVLAVLAELVRWWPRLGRSERLAGLGAVVAPFVALLAFGAWADHEVGDWLAPIRVQAEDAHHGGVTDPVTELFHDASGILHHHVGTALHVPWVLLALAMLVVCWRRLPAPYTLFAAGVLVVALSGSNLDSFERYAMSAFPLSMAAAFLLDHSQLERTVLTLLAAGLAGYALLAFLNISVP
jgi:hypothetical protein